RHPAPAPASAPVARTAESRLGGRQFTTPEVLRTAQFWAMYAAFVLMSTGVLLVTAEAGPIAQSWGYTAAVLTLAASLSPLANGGSRIFWGWASDRVRRVNTR